MTKDSERPNNENINQPTSAPITEKKRGMNYIIIVIILAAIAIYGLKGQFGQVLTKNDSVQVSVAGNSFSQSQTEEIQNIAKDYIEGHPEVIIASLQNMEKKAMGEKVAKAQDYISKNLNAIDSDKPFLGNKNASIVITKFFDYRCGHCKHAHDTIDRLLATDPNLKVVLIETPVLGPQSYSAAKAALAVFKMDPSKFAQFNSKLFGTQDYSDASLVRLATSIGLDKTKFTTMFNSPEVTKGIENNLEIARNLQLQGVPAFIVGEEFIPGSIDYDALKGKIDALKKAPAAASNSAAPIEAKAPAPEAAVGQAE